MTDTVVHRPPRRPRPDPATTPVRLAPPPALADGSGASSWTYALFPVLGSAGMLVIALLNGNPLFLIAGGVFVLGSIGMGLAMWLQVRGRSRGQAVDTRSRYFAHLADVRRQLREAVEDQLTAARAVHPEPTALLGLTRTPARVWERRPGDEDFLQLRLGTGDVPAAALPALAEPDPTQVLDPAARAAAERLVAAHARVAGAPVAVPLTDGTTTLVGSPEQARAVARALLCQLAVLHAPDDVRVAVCVPAGTRAAAEWSWVEWLPHVQHPGSPDDGTSGLLLAEDAAHLVSLLGAELERRRTQQRSRPSAPGGAGNGPALLVVVDGWAGSPDPLAGLAALGVAQLRLVAEDDQEPSEVDLTVRVAPVARHERPALELLARSPERRAAELARAVDVRGDVLSVAEAEVLARSLAPLRLSRRAVEGSLSEVTGLPELLGIDDIGRLEPHRTWAARSERMLLRVPLGVDAQGRPVELDLKESALGGMGPHGLVVGATGSGKSELLRTLVTGLAITHSPDDLAFVLVDYKGGATFAGLSGLPHVAGSVTDLEDDPATIDRVAAALRGELRRREELLRASGDLSSIREHRQRRLAGAQVPAMPHLLVVVDEFSELLAQQPDFIDVFVTIGRLGRSLGVHLLLATQRLEEGRLRGLDSHLSYRLALRTFSAAESRAVIGSADAFELPPVPGSAYLKVDTSVYDRLRVSTVSSPHVEPRTRPVVPADRELRPFRGFDADPGRAPLPAIGLDLSDPEQRSTLDVAVERLAAAAERVHQVWLPPLPRAVHLAAPLGPLRPDAERGLTAGGPVGRLWAPVGVVDLPDRQRQEALTVDLAAAGGHVGVVGAPQTGKTTLLRTLVTSLALTHTPAELQVYCLDLGGGGLGALAGLPHVGTVAGRGQRELVRRVVAQMGALVDERERSFAAHGIDAVDTFRERRRTGGAPEDGHGDVLLVVDGWAALRTDFEDLEPAITALAARGSAYGLHVVVAAPRWFDLRPAVRDLLGTKLELRLGEPADTLLDRAAARALPPDVPGRLLITGARVAQVAVVDDLPALVEQCARQWSGPGAPPVLLLPARVTVDELPPDDADEPGVPIGVRETDLRAGRLDLVSGPDPHLLVLGDPGSGKSATLRTLVRAMTARCSPDELRVVVVDYRRALLDAVDDASLSQYCASAPVAAGTIAALAERLAARMPGPDVPRAQLRARSWWSGPRALVVVDDHDLVAAPSGDPLTPLLELLPVAADVGLHLVVARAAGGAATGMVQPTLRRLRELGTPGLLHSGSRDEGVVLHGARLQALPPGRALHVSRHHPAELLQVAWTPEGD